MTPEDEIRRTHHRRHVTHIDRTVEFCGRCMTPWPCAPTRAAAALDDLRAEVAGYRRAALVGELQPDGGIVIDRIDYAAPVTRDVIDLREQP